MLVLLLILFPAITWAWEPSCPLGSNPDASWVLCLDAEEFDYQVTGIANNGSGLIRLTHANNPVPNAWATSTTYPITGTVKAEDGSVRIRSSSNMAPQLIHNGFAALVNVGGTVEANGRHRVRTIIRKASANVAADTITLDSGINGLQENDQVYINLGYNTDGAVVSSLAGPGLGNVYFVKGLAGNTFQISTTAGGAAVNMTSTAGVILVRGASLIDLPEVGYQNAWTSGGIISKRFAVVKNSSLPYEYWPITNVDATHVDLVGSTYSGQTGNWLVSPCDSSGQSEECFLVTGGSNYIASSTLYDPQAFKIMPCKSPVGTHCFHGDPVRGGSGSGYNPVAITPTDEISVRYYEREIGLKNSLGSHGVAVVMNHGSILAVEPQQTGWFMIYEASGQTSTALGGGQNWFPTVLQTAVPVVSSSKWHLYEIHAKMETTWTDGISRTIASFSNDGTGKIRVNLSDPHGHFNGNTVTISGADASWGANGNWTIEQAGSATIDPGSFVLTGSTYAAGSGSVGTAVLKNGKGEPGECDGDLTVWIDNTLVLSYPTICFGRLNNALPGHVGLQFATVWAPRRYEHRNIDAGAIEIDGVVVKTSSFSGGGPYIGASVVENAANMGVNGHPFMAFNGGQDTVACLMDQLNAPGGTSAYTGAMCKSGYSTSNNIGASGLSSGAGGAIRVTATYEHGLWTGDQVFLSGTGLAGTNASGAWTITRISDTAFDLNGSTYGSTNASASRFDNRYGMRKAFVDCSQSSSIYSKTGSLQLFANLGWRNRPGTIDPAITAPGKTISPLCGANVPSSSATTTSTISGLQSSQALLGSYKLRVDGSLCTTVNCGAGVYHGRNAGAYTNSGTQNPGGVILTGCGGNLIKTCGPDYLHPTQVVNQWMLVPASLPISTYSSCDVTNKSCVAYSGFVGTTTTSYGNFLAITITSTGKWGVVQRDNNDNARKQVYEGSVPVSFDKWDRVELVAYLNGADKDKFSLRVNGQLAIDTQALTYSISQNGGTGRNWLYCSIPAGESCSNPGAVEGIIEHVLGSGDVSIWIDQFVYANASIQSCDGWSGDLAACPFNPPQKTTKTLIRRRS